MERDYRCARDELVLTREERDRLLSEVQRLEALVARSVWSSSQVQDLIKSMSTQPTKSRRALACALLEMVFFFSLSR